MLLAKSYNLPNIVLPVGGIITNMHFVCRVHCTALRADISAFVRRYLCPGPQISQSWPADISARELSCPNYTLRGIIGGKIKKCTPVVSSHSSSRQMALCFIRMDFLYYRCLFEPAKSDGSQPPKKH